MTKEKIREFIKKQNSFNYGSYKDIGHDRLLLYCAYLLEKNNFEILSIDVGVLAFKLFPKKFEIEGYSEYPDFEKIRNTLWHLYDKSKGWLSGRPQCGFSISEIGEVIAKKTNDALNKGIPLIFGKSRRDKQKRKEIKEVENIKKSVAFKKFKRGGKIDMKEIGELFMLPSDAPLEIFEGKIRLIKEYSKEKEILGFIKKVLKILKNEK